VQVRPKKIRLRGGAGKLAVEQTSDRALIAGFLSAAGIPGVSVESPGYCYLVAYVDHEAAGVVGIETRVDTGLIQSLVVTEAMRGRGIGSALIAAARTAAHTRGARALYVIAPDERGAGYFSRFGFVPVPFENLKAAISGMRAAAWQHYPDGDRLRLLAMTLDIANDGIIQR
jgi:GNAT superfamily N-acetyltransferase